jgi:hypothetical protein
LTVIAFFVTPPAAFTAETVTRALSAERFLHALRSLRRLEALSFTNIVFDFPTLDAT